MLNNSHIVTYLEDKQIEDVPIDFAFVTALPKERDAILKQLDSYRKVQVDLEPLTYYRGCINIPITGERYEIVVIMLLGMGNGDATVSTMEVIKRWQPTYVIMVGIAGGVPNKVTLGDVVVANFIYYYELAKRTSKGDRRRAQYFYSDRLLYDRALAYEADDWKYDIGKERLDTLHTSVHMPKVHFGGIASGEKVLADTKTLSRLLNECPELFAVAMEGAGVARAASHQTHLTRFLEVRSICDYANEQKNDDWQEFAAFVAAAFIVGLLRSRPVPPSSGKQLTRLLMPSTQSSISMIADERVCKENLETRVTEATSIDAMDLIVHDVLANPTTGIYKQLHSPDIYANENNRERSPLLETRQNYFIRLRDEAPEVGKQSTDAEQSEITDPHFFKRLANVRKQSHFQPFDQMFCELASIADLNHEEATRFFQRNRVQLQEDFVSNCILKDQLEHFEFLQEGHPTYATLLCFGLKPTRWLSGAFTRCTLWRGNDRHSGWLDAQDYRGNLISQFEASSGFLQKSLHWVRFIERDKRSEELEIPLIALQEALANALVHREYANQTSGTCIDVFNNRVEFNSSGGLPEPVTLEILQEEHSSHPRNPQIARIFYLHGYVDKVGTGIQRIKRHIESAGLPPIELMLGKDKTFKVIFYRP